jgi:Zn-dependent peptidase ImmA (M78 family)
MDAVDRIIKAFNLNTAPIDVEAITEELGIEIQHKELPNNHPGYAECSNGQPLIVINKKHSKDRGRFTLAHELGHHLLHESDLLKEGSLDRIGYNHYHDDYREFEANDFSARLLMPEHIVRAYYDEYTVDGYVDVSALAYIFKVSIDAMRFRLNKIGI